MSNKRFSHALEKKKKIKIKNNNKQAQYLKFK